MKRVDLIRKLSELGCVLTRHGGRHDWYTNPALKTSQPVPRHSEINEAIGEAYHTQAGRIEPVSVCAKVGGEATRVHGIMQLPLADVLPLTVFAEFISG